jgi:hypothetical protein
MAYALRKRSEVASSPNLSSWTPAHGMLPFEQSGGAVARGGRQSRLLDSDTSTRWRSWFRMAVIVPVAIAAAAVLGATPLDRFDRCGWCAWTLKGDMSGQGVGVVVTWR